MNVKKELKELNSKEMRRQGLINYLYAVGGEILNDEDTALEELNVAIENDYINFGMAIAKKDIDTQISYLKERKKLIDEEIKLLEKIKTKIKYKVHQWLLKVGSVEVEDDGIVKYLKAGNTTRKSINSEKVKPEDGKYVVTFKAEDWNSMPAKIVNKAVKIEHKVLVSELPIEHPALELELNPQIKLVKNK